jgi:hypothetical protein
MVGSVGSLVAFLCGNVRSYGAGWDSDAGRRKKSLELRSEENQEDQKQNKIQQKQNPDNLEALVEPHIPKSSVISTKEETEEQPVVFERVVPKQ